MNKVFIIACCASLLWACNSRSNTSEYDKEQGRMDSNQQTITDTSANADPNTRGLDSTGVRNKNQNVPDTGRNKQH